ncbi:uroporphyrinogen-III synthase [Thermoproteota archaeon]
MKNDCLTLHGKIVAVTRPKHQSRDIINLINACGGEALLAPTIEIVPGESQVLDAFTKEVIVREYDYLIFLSANSVTYLMENARSKGVLSQLIESIGQMTILCIGDKTQARLEASGISGNYAKIQTTEGVIQALGHDLNGIRIGIPRSSLADETLREALMHRGAKVREVTAYSTTLPRDTSLVVDLVKKLNNGKVDAVTFTSSSTAKNLLTIAKNNKLETQLREGLARTIIVAIGPRTKQTINDLDIHVDIVPTKYSIESMIDALVDKVKGENVETQNN